MMLATAVLIAVFAAVLIIVYTTTPLTGKADFPMGTILLVFGGALGILAGTTIGSAVWQGRRIRRDLARRPPPIAPPADGTEVVVAALEKLWTHPARPPKPKPIVDLVRALSPTYLTRAQIVCLGEIELPHASETFFEPEILAPEHLLRSHGMRAIMLAGAALVVMTQTYFAPSLRAFQGPVLGVLAAIAIPAVLIWFWFAMIRPSYVRMAPGIVQFLTFGGKSRGPVSCRSYEMTPGTIVIVSQPGFHGAWHLSGLKRRSAWSERFLKQMRFAGVRVVFARDRHHDELRLVNIAKPAEVLEKLLQSITSTARIPELPTTELVR